MIAADRVVAVLLAAGRSERFGLGDKLGAMLGERPVAHHAAAALAAIGFGRMIVVGSTDLRGFETVPNPRPERGQASSIALGVEAALTSAPKAILIGLADMPLVSPAHLLRLLKAFPPGGIVASVADGMPPCPPALFAASQASRLLALSGDTGARALLADALLVRTDAGELADIDTLEDLNRLRAGPSA